MILLDPLARPVIAHRGDRAHAPENTVFACEQALAADADAVEIDVRTCASGEVIVFHDATVDRTTDGVGAVESLSLAAIRELDAGAHTPHAGRGLRVPLLREVLESCPAAAIIIEAKTALAGTAIVNVLRQFGAQSRVLIGSFIHAAILPARRAGFRTLASRRELAGLLPAALLHRHFRAAAFDAISIPPTQWGIPLPVGGFGRGSQLPVHVWTVDDPNQARRYWRQGVCGIITDDPHRLVLERDRAT